MLKTVRGDYAMRKTKKFAVILLAAILLGGCGSEGVPREEYESVVAERDEYKEKYEILLGQEGAMKEGHAQENQSEQEQEKEPSQAIEDKKIEDKEIEAEVVEEYYYINSIGAAQYFLIVKNNSTETISVSINATAKDAEGNLIGAKAGSEDAIPSGYEVCIDFYFSDAKNAASFEYTLDAKKDEYYDAVIQDLSYEESRTDKKIIISCTNNGNEAAKFVEATALFFLNGELIRSDSTYITDDDSEIKPGATIIKEMNSFGQYDDAKIYLSGRK